MPTAQSHHIEREHAEAEQTPAIELDPSAVTAALERRISM
jgi:hypothetical protein